MGGFTIVPGYFGPRVRGKLAGQRKERSFSVSPTSEGKIMVQAEGCIGEFDFRTRKGVFNTKGGYFLHLSKALGARDFEFPAEFVRLALEVCPALDSETTRGGVTIVNTVQVIR